MILSFARRGAVRHRALGQILAIALLAACSSGQTFHGFIDPKLMDSYIPLYDRTFLIDRFAGAMVIAPNVAVTNAHNANLVTESAVLARSTEYDLLFFRTDRMVVPPIGSPYIGEDVIAYGQSGKSDLSEAKGVIRLLEAYLPQRCPQCRLQRSMAYDAEAGRGYSGGPVVDAASGAVLGITFAFEDGRGEGGGRRMYAYDMDIVLSEMDRLLNAGAR